MRTTDTQNVHPDLHKLAQDLDAKIAGLPDWVQQLFRQRAMTALLIEAQRRPVLDDSLPALLRPQA